MRLSVADLQKENQYQCIAAFHVDETMAFLNDPDSLSDVKDPIKKRNHWPIFFSILIGFVFGYCIINYFRNYSGLYAMYGFIATLIVLLPVHEWIHGLTYKSLGAKDVGYGYSVKAFMIYAYAQDFPISMKELIKVAIMPFAIITMLLITLIFVVPSYSMIIVFALIFHSLSCIGDFALVRYALKNLHNNIFTYDDIRREKKTYFFKKISAQ